MLIIFTLVSQSDVGTETGNKSRQIPEKDLNNSGKNVESSTEKNLIEDDDIESLEGDTEKFMSDQSNTAQASTPELSKLND